MQNELEKRMLERKKRKIKRKVVRVTTGITALTLTCSLAIQQYNYKRSDKFHFSPDRNGNLTVSKFNYISNNNLYNYYFVELYHTGLQRSVIFIASRFKYTTGNSEYINIFNNNFIAYDNNTKDFYEFVNVIPLSNILEEYGLEQEKYYYKDMLEIYEILKNNYDYTDTSIYQEKLEENTLKVKKRILE